MIRAMLAVYASAIDRDDPLKGLRIDERPEPEPADAWATVTVKAASLNHHDLWSLRGVGLPEERLPMTLGCDAAGLDEEGNEVVVHSVISEDSWRGDETFDPRRSILSERHQGTFADRVAVPRRNLIPKPSELSFEQAACLPTAWLTAYRMLFTRGQVRPGQTVLVQGASGGLSTALVVLAHAAGIRVWVTGRSEKGRAEALSLGADQAFETGARLPERVDAVMESVGKATWAHSVRSLKPGGTIVISGATTGDAVARRAEPDLLPAALGGGLDDGDARRARAADPPVRGEGRAARDRQDAPARGRPRRIRGDARRRDGREDRLYALNSRGSAVAIPCTPRERSTSIARRSFTVHAYSSPRRSITSSSSHGSISRCCAITASQRRE